MRWLLFSGLGILTLGLVLNFTSEKSWPVALIITGVGLKIIYIIVKMIKSRYRPAGEVVFLVTGLLLFFTGLYLAPHANAGIFSISTLLKITGIALKLVFVVLFIRKTNRT